MQAPLEMLSLTLDQRRQLLEETADKVGGKVALGRRLGYQDGSFVGQMIRGERPVSESTLRRLSGIHAAREIALRMSGSKSEVLQPYEPATRGAGNLSSPADLDAILASRLSSMRPAKWAMARALLDLIVSSPSGQHEALAELQKLLEEQPWDGVTERRTGPSDRRHSVERDSAPEGKRSAG